MKKIAKNITGTFLIALLSVGLTACGGGGGGGGGGNDNGGDTGGDTGGDNGGDNGGDTGFVIPLNADLQGDIITIVFSNGTTLQYVHQSGAFDTTIDIPTGDTLFAAYDTLNTLEFEISRELGQDGPLFLYEMTTVEWTSATTANLTGTFDADRFDAEAPIPVTGSLTVTNQ